MDSLTKKLSAKFLASAKVIKANDEKLAQAASLDILANVFDDDIVEDIKNNPDLLFIASTLLKLGYANKNGDAIMPVDFIPIVNNFKNKYINIEHSRKDIVGAINEFAFKSGDIYIEDDVVQRLIELDEPVEFVIGGFVWRVVNDDLCKLIEESSALQDDKISTSFEIFFEYYDICVSPSLRVLDGKIYTAEDKEFESYNKLLRYNNGSGKLGDMNVFRILRGPLVPAGAGLVSNPASGIKGVLALYGNVTATEEPDDVKNPDNIELTNEKQGDKDIECQILSVNNTITQEKNKMPITINSLEDIQSNWAELQKSEAQASVITEFVKKRLEDLSLDYANKIKEKEDAEAQAKAQIDALTEKVNKLEEINSEASAKLKEIEQKQAIAEAEAAFNSRMAEVDAEFDLDEDSTKVIVEEVREITTDEAFASWMNKKRTLLKDKTKAATKERKEKAEAAKAAAIAAGVKPEALAGENINFAEILSTLKEVSANEAVTTAVTQNTDLKEKMRIKFAEKTKINGKNFKK